MIQMNRVYVDHINDRIVETTKYCICNTSPFFVEFKLINASWSESKTLDRSFVPKSFSQEIEKDNPDFDFLERFLDKVQSLKAFL